MGQKIFLIVLVIAGGSFIVSHLITKPVDTSSKPTATQVRPVSEQVQQDHEMQLPTEAGNLEQINETKDAELSAQQDIQEDRPEPTYEPRETSPILVM